MKGRKFMKRKVIAALLAATMVFGAVGCGGKSADQGSTPETTPNAAGNEAGTTENNDNAADTGSEEAGSEEAGSEEAAGEDGYTVQIDPATGEPYDLGGMEVIIADWLS